MSRASACDQLPKVRDRSVMLGKELDDGRVGMEEDEIGFSSAVRMKNQLALVDDLRLLPKTHPFVGVHRHGVVRVQFQ